MRETLKGIAFDLDGTLYPNYRLNVRLLPFLLKEWRLLAAFGKARAIIRNQQEENLKNSQFSTLNSQSSPPDSQFSILNSQSFYNYQAELTAKILSADSELIKDKIERLIYRGWEPLFKKVKLFDGVIETLDALKKAGLKMGLMSDFPPETKIKYLGISDYWDVVHCSEDSGTLKPHPLSFIKLADAMEMPPENILYVGNSHPYDIVGAGRAGMKTAWLKSIISEKKIPKPDFSFKNYRKLYNFMIH